MYFPATFILYVIFFSWFSNFPLENVGANIIHGVKGVKFEGTKNLFNHTSNPEAQCYCSGNECEYKPGVRNVTACVKAPVFVSFPHFYAADPSYLNGVTGLNPRAEKHKFHFTLQKVSLLSLISLRQMQNISLRRLLQRKILNFYDWAKSSLRYLWSLRKCFAYCPKLAIGLYSNIFFLT